MSVAVLPEPFWRPHTLQIHDFNEALAGLGYPLRTTRGRNASLQMGRLLSSTSAFRHYGRSSDDTLICSLMWPSVSRLFPYAARNAIVPFVFDCWPSDYDKWEAMLGRFETPISFFTSRGSSDHFRDLGVAGDVHWLPEAVDVERYWGERRLDEREVSVLEIGRRHEGAHLAIRAALDGTSFTHLFADRGWLFPDRSALIAGLRRSAVLVCYPKSVTHPEAAGNLETATLRYFEAMASGCLMVGQAPAELIASCGYDPVLPLSPDDVGHGIADILQHGLSSHQALVDRNRVWVKNNASWTVRAQELQNILRRSGLD